MVEHKIATLYCNFIQICYILIKKWFSFSFSLLLACSHVVVAWLGQQSFSKLLGLFLQPHIHVDTSPSSLAQEPVLAKACLYHVGLAFRDL